jgi:hypothetical protein
MTLAELIALLENQITTLNVARTTAGHLGDIQRTMEIDAKIAETQNTLTALRETVP